MILLAKNIEVNVNSETFFIQIEAQTQTAPILDGIALKLNIPSEREL